LGREEACYFPYPGFGEVPWKKGEREEREEE
jgi:hypothetical protein